MGLVFAKAALEHFPPILLMAFRFALTALILVWFVKPPKGLFIPIAWVAFVSATIQYGFTFTGLKFLDASTVVILIQLEVPFGVMIAALWLKEYVGWRRAIGIGIAFVGVFFIVGQPRLHGSLLPMLMVVCGALTWAIGQNMVKRLGALGGFRLTAWVAIFATPQLFIASFIFETGQIDAIANADWVVWGAVIYLALVMTALGYGIWYRLLGLYDVKQVMPYLLLIPVSTVLGSVMFLGEVLTVDIIIGGSIVIVGVGLITIEFGQRKKS
jgi:O-acetylserine/cysteine efflux transporter